MHDAVWRVGICLISTYFHSNGQKPNYTCMWNESLWLVVRYVHCCFKKYNWVNFMTGTKTSPVQRSFTQTANLREEIYMYNLHKNIANKKNYSHLRFLHYVAISININIYSPYFNIMLIYIRFVNRASMFIIL